MSTDKYNGWSNYETWVVKLWIDNEEGSYNYWRERAQEVANEYGKEDSDGKQTLATELQEQHEEAQPETRGVFADLLGHAMGRVDWWEIAENMLDDVEPEATDTDEEQS